MAGVIERTESPSTWVAVNVGIDFEVNAFRAVEQNEILSSDRARPEFTSACPQVPMVRHSPILYSGGG
jgi:hypothetical protein